MWHIILKDIKVTLQVVTLKFENLCAAARLCGARAKFEEFVLEPKPPEVIRQREAKMVFGL